MMAKSHVQYQNSLLSSLHESKKEKRENLSVLNFGNATLDVENLHLKKVDIRNKTVMDADFFVKAKVVDRDDVQEKIEDRIPQPKPHPKPHPRPHPRPRPNSAIIGFAGMKELTCEHRGFYLLAYGKKPEPREAVQWKDRKLHPVPRPVRKFFVMVEGCRRLNPKKNRFEILILF